uniref:Ribosomal protein L23 n=1 Tax=Pleurostichidium falkenbergii TaxID=121064 RepID=A0A4D6UXV8_9FLOR|nr:ribosomal protein L23 [Pleurostichidium falkenbergii]QCH39696.1 ribosomal protein L23 [Pleurostichidium falkenbergii]
MNITKNYSKIIKPDIIRYPIITDKTTKNIESNTYWFKVVKNSNKNEIKTSVENIFNVKVKKINTLNIPPKTKTIGKFKGRTTEYKKAMVQLFKEYTIELFDN